MYIWEKKNNSFYYIWIEEIQILGDTNIRRPRFSINIKKKLLNILFFEKTKTKQKQIKNKKQKQIVIKQKHILKKKKKAK